MNHLKSLYIRVVGLFFSKLLFIDDSLMKQILDVCSPHSRIPLRLSLTRKSQAQIKFSDSEWKAKLAANQSLAIQIDV